jgi:hypothetical protein
MHQQHEDELRAKGNDMDLTRRMLLVARQVGAEKNEVQEQEEQPIHKRRRVEAVKQEPLHESDSHEASEALAVQVPPVVTSSSTASVDEAAAVKSEFSPLVASSSTAAQEVKTSNGVPQTGHGQPLTEVIQENLLGLFYAMFDTLFATNSFQAKYFCQVLIKMGERSLTKEIALAAVEMSSGEKSDVT